MFEDSSYRKIETYSADIRACRTDRVGIWWSCSNWCRFSNNERIVQSCSFSSIDFFLKMKLRDSYSKWCKWNSFNRFIYLCKKWYRLILTYATDTKTLSTAATVRSAEWWTFRSKNRKMCRNRTCVLEWNNFYEPTSTLFLK